MTGISDIVYGLFQGATEFLPVSSSGHLFLMDWILNGESSSLTFVLFLHLATFLVICLVFFKDIGNFLWNLKTRQNQILFLKLLVSLIPLVIVGLFLRSFVQQSFEKNTVALGFFSTALLLSSLFFIKRKDRSLEEMSFFHAFLIGLSQSLAVLPGFSRSAWTIATGLYCGLSPRWAVYFSFLISLPAIFGSVLVEFVFYESKDPQMLTSLSSFSEWGFLSLSFFSAFFSGLFCLLLVIKMVQSQKLYLFAFYLFPLSLFVFLFL